MGLQQTLTAFKEEFARTAPEGLAALYKPEIAELRASSLCDGAIRPAEEVPDFRLPGAKGNSVSLHDEIASGPVVVTFYRGGWCPCSNIQLKAYQEILPQIRSYGAKLISISPELPDQSLTTAEKNGLGFDVLSGLRNKVARTFGIVFALPEELRAAMTANGEALPRINGDESWELLLRRPSSSTETTPLRSRISTLTTATGSSPTRFSPHLNRFRFDKAGRGAAAEQTGVPFTHLFLEIQMIRFYFHPTPNPAKVALFLEEAGLSYKTIPVDTSKGEQHLPAFRAINPNGKVPAIVDTYGPGGQETRVFDSTAILIYLAEKTGKFLGSVEDRPELLSWLMFLASGLGPFSGQAVHFQHAAPEGLDYAVNRYRREAERHYQVLNDHLEGRSFIVGNDYTIADMSAWGWLDRASRVLKGVGDPLAAYPNLKRLFETINSRAAVARAREVGKDHAFKRINDDETKRALFPSNFPPAA